LHSGGKVCSPRKCSSGERRATASILNWTVSGHATIPLPRSARICGGVSEEADARGYAFDTAKIALRLSPISLFVTQGQLEFEWKHLRRKLSVRDPARYRSLTVAKLRSHPMLRVIAGA
jgi:hypothetical protein